MLWGFATPQDHAALSAEAAVSCHVYAACLTAALLLGMVCSFCQALCLTGSTAHAPLCHYQMLSNMLHLAGATFVQTIVELSLQLRKAVVAAHTVLL